MRISTLKTGDTAGDAGGTVVYWDLVPHDVPGRLGSNLVRVPAGCITHRHSHAWDQLNVILEGYGILNLDGVDHPVRKGDVIYIEPGEVHGYRNEGEDVLVILGVLGLRPL